MNDAFVFPDELRYRHLYVIGKPQLGKSTLIENLAIQDIVANRGVTIIDPHGDLSLHLLDLIPKHRVNDTIYFDAVDHPIPLKIFEPASEREANQMASDLLYLFQRLDRNWQVRMEHILKFAVHTIVRAPGTTFFDVQRVLTDRKFRERKILPHIKKPELLNFWRRQFPDYDKPHVLLPILTRITDYELSPVLKSVLGNPNAVLRVSDVLEEQKIFIVRIPKGELGHDDLSIIGTVIVSQLQIAVLRRARPGSPRHPYYAYIDEFHNFIAGPFDEIIAESGKYKLYVTLAHQMLSQLDEYPAIKKVVPHIVDNYVFFQLAKEDAREFAHLVEPYYRDEDLRKLPRRKAIVKLSGRPARRIGALRPPRSVASFAEQIITRTKERYGVPQYAPSNEAEDQQPRSEPPEPGVGPPVPPRRA